MWHLCSLAVKVAERSFDDEEESDALYGKLVRAFGPHMSLAASSYALAASSAVSKVPSHILVFLWSKNRALLKMCDQFSIKNMCNIYIIMSNCIIM